MGLCVCSQASICLIFQPWLFPCVCPQIGDICKTSAEDVKKAGFKFGKHAFSLLTHLNSWRHYPLFNHITNLGRQECIRIKKHVLQSWPDLSLLELCDFGQVVSPPELQFVCKFEQYKHKLSRGPGTRYSRLKVFSQHWHEYIKTKR